MADPAKLEINSWIETVRKQIEQSEKANSANRNANRSNANRGKRGRGNVPAEPSEAQAALIALTDLHNLLVTRAAEIDQHELEFAERSQRLDAATTQLEEQLKQLTAKQSASRDTDSVSSAWAIDTAQPQSTLPSPSSSDETADRIAERITNQLTAVLEEKFQQLGDRFNRNSTVATIDAATDDQAVSNLSELRIELEVARTLLRENEQLLHEVAIDAEAKTNELRDELAAVYESNTALRAELCAVNDARRNDIENTFLKDEMNESYASDANEIANLQAEIESLQDTLAAVRSATWETSKNESIDAEQMAAELADLREQNTDLATQLARLQMTGLHNPPHLNLSNLNQESMTWEQRKRLILQQLENETAAANPEEYQNHRNEVEAILRTTQCEIERREQEITELKSIIEQQSNTREGVAIGAAAIAQMIDSDELVLAEREKLAAIQKEWEAKLREAEIEMSLERAKLSRERAELEERLRKPDAVKPASTETSSSADGKPVRRWLEHLGLREK